MSAENFTVRAVGFAPLEQTVDTLRSLNKLMIDEMNDKAYFPLETDPFELYAGGRPRLKLTFATQLTKPRKSLSRRISGLIRIEDNAPPSREEAFESLRGTISALPNFITFRLAYSTLSDGSKGIQIEMDSEPLIVAKRRSIHEPQNVDKTEYDDIISNNKKFLRDILSALGLKILTEPAPIKEMEFPKLAPLFDFKFTSMFPDDLKYCLDAASSCFISEHTLACSILLRKALEVGIHRKFEQEGKKSRLIDKEGNELSLKSKLNIVSEVAPNTRNELEETKLIKWLSDKAVHDPSVRISSDDIKGNILIIKSFLKDLELKI